MVFSLYLLLYLLSRSMDKIPPCFGSAECIV